MNPGATKLVMPTALFAKNAVGMTNLVIIGFKLWTRKKSPVHNLPAIRMQNLSAKIRRVFTCQKHITGGNFTWLSWSFKRSVLTKFFHFFWRKCRRNQRSPDWPGSYKHLHGFLFQRDCRIKIGYKL